MKPRPQIVAWSLLLPFLPVAIAVEALAIRVGPPTTPRITSEGASFEWAVTSHFRSSRSQERNSRSASSTRYLSPSASLSPSIQHLLPGSVRCSEA
jgi:hypothetical protein